MAILWRPSLETGLEQVDDQHQEIFKRANKLIEINKSDLGREAGYEEAVELLEFLQDYIKKHFREEEQLQRKYDYPDYEHHKQVHDNLVQETKDLIDKFNQRENSLAALSELNKFILNWLVGHIDQEDRKVVKHIKKHK